MPFMCVTAIARREWALLRRDPKPRILIVVVTVLIPLTVYANAREFEGLQMRVHALQAERDAEKEKKGGALTEGAMEPLLRVVREPTIAFILVNGHHLHLPVSWDVGAAGLRYGLSPASHTTGGPRLDAEFIVRVVIGLFALLLGLETIGGERQNNTLRPLLAQPISTTSLLVGKCLANAVVLLAIVLWTTAIGYGTLAIYLQTRAPSLSVLGGLVMSAFPYLMVCFFLGLACASFGSRVGPAQTVALSLWLFQSVVSVPLVSAAIDAFAHPRTRADFEGELQRAYNITDREASRRLGTEFLSRVRQADGWEADWLKIEQSAVEQQRMVRVLEPLWRENAERWSQDMIAREIQWNVGRQRQERITSWASTLSAGLLFYRVVGDLAGTGATSADLWYRAVARYQAALYEPLVGHREALVLRVPTDESYQLFKLQRQNEQRLSDMPVFEPPAGSRAAIRPVDIARLAGQVCVGAGISGIAFGRLRRRYFEVR